MELVCWNVRGLNSPTKKKTLREFVDTVHVAILCILESKLERVDQFTIMQCLGPSFDGFAYLPAIETRGGVILAWKSSDLEVEAIQIDTNFLTGRVRTKTGDPWWISVVYGPQSDEQKCNFLE